MAVALAAWPSQKKKKSKKADEEVTQVLELPKEPPATVVAGTDRLAFQVSPLSARGLLSQQLRDALKWLLRQEGTVVRLRAFVAGSGDTRRVPMIVGEVFSEKRLSLPALSVVRIGALPMDGAQVLLEAVMAEKKPVNPNGLAFVSGQSAFVSQPLQPVVPLAEKSLGRLQSALKSAGVENRDVLSVGCYLTSLDDADKIRAAAAAQFPRAALSIVQPLRAPLQTSASCDAVARLEAPPRGPLDLLNPPDLKPAGPYSAIALIGPGRVAFSSAQLAFGTSDGDARLAFQRLGKTLEEVTASYEQTAVAEIYSLSHSLDDLAMKAGSGFFDPAKPPAVTALPFEGLLSTDASFAVDVIVLLPEQK